MFSLKHPKHSLKSEAWLPSKHTQIYMYYLFIYILNCLWPIQCSQHRSLPLGFYSVSACFRRNLSKSDYSYTQYSMACRKIIFSKNFVWNKMITADTGMFSVGSFWGVQWKGLDIKAEGSDGCVTNADNNTENCRKLHNYCKASWRWHK